ELMGQDRLRASGLFDPQAVGRLFEKCRAGRATGFADNQAFVGVLSTMLVHDGLRQSAATARTEHPVEAPVPA
ncbi:MAG TPA: hypothetical protein VHF86_07085, partial [Xanthomonadaceae bacterium]|nr:hypothetical protein [Xanthomonadaceae bacterium]